MLTKPGGNPAREVWTQEAARVGRLNKNVPPDGAAPY